MAGPPALPLALYPDYPSLSPFLSRLPARVLSSWTESLACSRGNGIVSDVRRSSDAGMSFVSNDGVLAYQMCDNLAHIVIHSWLFPRGRSRVDRVTAPAPETTVTSRTGEIDGLQKYLVPPFNKEILSYGQPAHRPHHGPPRSTKEA